MPGKPGNRSDYNHFRARGTGPAHLEFGWRGTTFTGAGNYVRATGQDRHSSFPLALPLAAKLVAWLVTCLLVHASS